MNLDRVRDRFFAGVPRYQWLESLGRGGMGIIFKAKDVELDDIVAIKVLAPDLESDDQELLLRFKREIQLNRKIKHPNVARIHDFGTSGDFPYITMEYIPGVDLRRLIQREGPLGPLRSIAILRQIALGTEAAHKLGIVHRDLKSQNVMVEDSGAVAILDFGLARGKLNENLTIDSIMIGTPHYMPPEQALGKKTDSRSDIYSIGVMAFEMLTGNVPFTGESPLVIAMKQVSEPVPRAALDEVPEDLAAIVLKALAKDPEERFPSAAAFEAELNMVQLPAPVETEATPAQPQPSFKTPPPFKTVRVHLGDVTPVVPQRPSKAALPKAPAPADTPATVPPGAWRPGGPSEPPKPPRQPVTSTTAKTPHPSGSRPSLKSYAPTVLVVENDASHRAQVARQLSNSGCKTLEARSGQQALETLFKSSPDLVLMDVTLGDMDGFDVTRVIKSQPSSASIPVVLMSARLDRNHFAFGIQSGATDVLAKPVTAESLVPKIWGVLQHRGFPPPAGMAPPSGPRSLDLGIAGRR